MLECLGETYSSTVSQCGGEEMLYDGVLYLE